MMSSSNLYRALNYGAEGKATGWSQGITSSDKYRVGNIIVENEKCRMHKIGNKQENNKRNSHQIGRIIYVKPAELFSPPNTSRVFRVLNEYSNFGTWHRMRIANNYHCKKNSIIQ